MASLQKSYSIEKLHGVVYTPDFVVEKILNGVGYVGDGILGKTILDPACGDGQFLERVVLRILKHARSNGVSGESLKSCLQCVYGWDIDSHAVAVCKARLNACIAEYTISVNWNICVKDSLQKYDKNPVQFDYIVGNPPYVRVQHLDIKNRTYIQKQYEFCKSGATDIFVAFFERAYSLLSPSGVAGFITPNSYIRTNTARMLREFFASQKCISALHNFGALQVFEGVSTYTAITIFSRQKNDSMRYFTYDSWDSYTQRHIAPETLHGRVFWDFSNANTKYTTPLKRVADIFTGLATLADKVYVSKIIAEQNTTYILDNKIHGRIALERDILRPVIKASKYKAHNQDITEMILYPYRNTGDGVDIIPESELQQNYPLAYAYLLQNKDILNKRDAGKKNPVAWYAYGRSQGLTKCLGRKIIFSPMAKSPAFYVCDTADALIYSGYGMKSDYDLHTLSRILCSPELETYINANGADFRDGWKGYNKTILQEFLFDKSMLER